MDNFLTTSNIMFLVAFMTTAFAVFLYFKNPQVSMEQKQALLDQEVDNRAAVLAEVYKVEKESTDRRFSEFNNRLIESNTLANNHINTIDIKVTTLTNQIATMDKSITKLTTIIEERVAKKQ
ncbi:MAG: hypothetical protein NUV96_00520 [Candidatus Colwellbacteria bacterium]|nr:hypothetical protein [Candidatus Colwellbacteria bacterium]